MNSRVLTEISLLVFLIALNAFLTAAEVSITSVRKIRLRQMVDEGVSGARLVQDLAENSSCLLAAIQIGTTLASFFAAATNAVTIAPIVEGIVHASGITLLSDYAASLSLVLTTIVLAGIVLIFGELVPKNLALQYSERVAFLIARPLAIIIATLRPMASVISTITDAIVRLMGGPTGTTMPFVTEDEIKTMVDAGEEIGVLEESEKAMIYGVFDLSETIVREVMVPRVDMVMVDVGLPLREAAHVAIRSGYSRLPVYDETPDKIVGILHVKDLLAALISENTLKDIRSLLHTPYYVPETKRVDDLLREMQSMSIQMAIVVDEYGGTAGLVTVEDLLEEIVGEIRDEHDREEVPIEHVDENTVIFSGRVTLDEVNELLGLKLNSEDVDTIGGYVAKRLEKVPTRGDRLDVPGATIEVIAAAGRRAKRIRVKRLPPGDPLNEG